LGLLSKGHQVTVYNSNEHPFKKKNFKGVSIIRKFCPEILMGSFAHFIYDYLCTKDAINYNNFDIILHCGYQSAAPAIWYFRKKAKPLVVCNMDGLEWKRDKWSKSVKFITKLFERITIKSCRYLISDNIGIQNYYMNKFNASSKFIAYGSDINDTINKNSLKEYNVIKYKYFILVARLEPENSIESIIEGYLSSESGTPLLVVGKTNTGYGKYLLSNYNNYSNIKFLGGIYDKKKLDSLRKFSKLYFHGHTVGGTNPSLLESMALGCLIVYHDNDFNKSVVGNNGIPFKNLYDLKNIILRSEKKGIDNGNKMRKNCINLINSNYTWDKIVNEYESYFFSILKK
jgi:glycosyltransferase involved in cell wall biosynthesis